MVVAAAVLSGATAVRAADLRIVEYNVNADTTDTNSFNNASATTVETVLQAIGQHRLAGNAQQIDVLALTELAGVSNTKLSATLGTIVTDLNAVYGAGTYAANTTIDPTDDPTSTGNGPSGLIYNTRTVASVTGTVVGPGASSATDPRAPMQYAIQPANATAAAQFYLYLEHAKAEQGATDAATRANESVLVRQSADALGPTAHVIYTGDLNLAGGSNSTTTSGSGEQSYKNLIAAPGANLVDGSGNVTTAGAAQAVDPLDPTHTFLANSKSYTPLYTESAVDLTARFDLQLVSTPVTSTAGATGLQLVPYTQTAFGSSYYNGTTLTTDTAEGGTINTSTNTALFDLSNASTVLTDLTQISDHLPIVADYSFVAAPEPSSLPLLAAVALVPTLARRRRA